MSRLLASALALSTLLPALTLLALLAWLLALLTRLSARLLLSTLALLALTLLPLPRLFSALTLLSRLSLLALALTAFAWLLALLSGLRGSLLAILSAFARLTVALLLFARLGLRILDLSLATLTGALGLVGGTTLLLALAARIGHALRCAVGAALATRGALHLAIQFAAEVLEFAPRLTQ